MKAGGEVIYDRDRRHEISQISRPPVRGEGRALSRGLGLVAAMLVACSSPTSVVVEGIVVAVDGNLTNVRSFEVITTDGDRLRFQPDPFGEFAFPLPHLGSHMRSLDPVRVEYRIVEDETLLAVTIEDA